MPRLYKIDRHRATGVRKNFRQSATIYLFILPALIPMLVLVGIPLVQTVFFSFTNLKEKNFDVHWWGLESAQDGGQSPAAEALRQSGGGALAKVDPRGPAARSGIPTPDAWITEVNGEKVRNAAVLRRLLGKAEREVLHQGATSASLTFAAIPASAQATSTAVTSAPLNLKTVAVAYERIPFDWKPNASRDDATWGMVGLRNYREILVPGASETDAARQFYRALGVTALWTALNVSLHYIFGLGLALLLNRPVRGTRFYRVLLMLPWAVPIFVSAFAWRYLFNGKYGLFNILLEKMGRSQIPWLSDTTWTFVAATITNVWLGVPFMMIVLLAGLQAIPSDLFEAAEIDGCTRRQQIWNVTIPMLRPVSLTVILLGTIWTFNMFNIIWLLQNGGNAVEILATRAFRLFNDSKDFAMSAAYGVVILGVLLIFASIYWRILRKGAEEQY